MQKSSHVLLQILLWAAPGSGMKLVKSIRHRARGAARSSCWVYGVSRMAAGAGLVSYGPPSSPKEGLFSPVPCRGPCPIGAGRAPLARGGRLGLKGGTADGHARD